MSYVSEAQQLQADTEMKLTALYNLSLIHISEPTRRS